MSVNPNELLTVTQAARLKGVTRQWITHLIKAGRLPVVQIAGRSFVRQQDVLSYKAAPKPGRPKKAKPEQTTKKGRKK
jgi:excisionase family DNA binding protein